MRGQTRGSSRHPHPRPPSTHLGGHPAEPRRREEGVEGGTQGARVPPGTQGCRALPGTRRTQDAPLSLGSGPDPQILNRGDGRGAAARPSVGELGGRCPQGGKLARSPPCPGPSTGSKRRRTSQVGSRSAPCPGSAAEPRSEPRTAGEGPRQGGGTELHPGPHAVLLVTGWGAGDSSRDPSHQLRRSWQDKKPWVPEEREGEGDDRSPRGRP